MDAAADLASNSTQQIAATDRLHVGDTTCQVKQGAGSGLRVPAEKVGSGQVYAVQQRRARIPAVRPVVRQGREQVRGLREKTSPLRRVRRCEFHQGMP
ncbi:hypothetical protein TPA0598_03_08110 [Streptomyces lydicamycinicus]|uniref:Uncharacterized protein n=1 Tax=Streptomyces lydicamycinicus TaxID=1546107 RepID=A0A0P4R733_9ACTN|nr:hypothetical protein TPA0598_03_08110 [Streptomyces lydicamycinicus]